MWFVFKAAAAFLATWLVWYRLVLTKTARSVKDWGPAWLAPTASKAIFMFGSWWLNFTHNGEEVIAKSIFADGKHYVMPWHPHGALAIVATFFFSYLSSCKYPGGTMRFVCIAPLLLRIPFLSEFLLVCGGREQSYSTFDKLLRSGATVAVQPGGIREQVETDATQERLFFPGRLGFVRLAMKHGVPLLPIYVFGENQLFPTSGWTRKVNKWLYRNFKVGCLLIHGLGGLPNTPLVPNPLLLPTPGAGLHARWGNPVDVGGPNECPSDELVREMFERYVVELRRLFDTYKDELLPPEVAAQGLQIILRSQGGPEIVYPLAKPQ